MAWELKSNIYPAHLEVDNLFSHNWKGRQQVGCFIRCLVCDVESNTRNRNGDAKFVKKHRRCGLTVQ